MSIGVERLKTEMAELPERDPAELAFAETRARHPR